MVNIRKPLLIAAVLIAVVSGVGGCGRTGSRAADLSMAEQYPGPWNESFDLEITQALAANRIGGCGQYRFRRHYQTPGEAIVECTRDGNSWQAYLVFATTGKVMGPYAPDPTLR